MNSEEETFATALVAPTPLPSYRVGRLIHHWKNICYPQISGHDTDHVLKQPHRQQNIIQHPDAEAPDDYLLWARDPKGPVLPARHELTYEQK